MFTSFFIFAYFGMQLDDKLIIQACQHIFACQTLFFVLYFRWIETPLIYASSFHHHHMICAGTTTKEKRPCRSHALKGEKYCRICKPRYAGAEANIGLGNGAARGAGRSSYLPAGSLERCQALLQMGDFYDLTAEIAVIQTFFTQAQESLTEGEPYGRWARFRTLFRTLDAASRRDTPHDHTVFISTLLQIRALIDLCSTDNAAHEEIKRLAKLLSELQEKQAKMEALHAETVPMNKMRMLFAAMLISTYDGIPDDLTGLTGADLRADQSRRLRNLFNRPEIPERVKRRYANSLDDIKEPEKPATEIIDVTPKPGVSYVEHEHFATDSKGVKEQSDFDFSDLAAVFDEASASVTELNTGENPTIDIDPRSESQ